MDDLGLGELAALPHRDGLEHPLEAALHGAGLRSARGRVEELRTVREEVEAVVALEGCGPLPRVGAGDEVELSFHGPWLERPVTARARVALVVPGAEGARVLVRLVSAVHEPLARMANRRQAFRVRPDPERPVEAIVGPPDRAEALVARVVDVSALGVSLLAPLDADGPTGLGGGWTVDLVLAVPDTDPVGFGGRVRYRLLRDAGVQLGVSFDPARTREFGPRQRRVLSYVIRRQAEVLGEA